MEVSKVGSLYESQSTLCHFNRIKEKKKKNKKKTLAHRKSISLNLAHFLIGVKKKKKKEQIELSQSKVPVKDSQLTSYIIMKN